jgi:hypothetical protein
MIIVVFPDLLAASQNDLKARAKSLKRVLLFKKNLLCLKSASKENGSTTSNWQKGTAGETRRRVCQERHGSHRS